MDSSTWRGRGYHLLLLLNRLSLGVLFFVAGLGKITSDAGVSGFVKGPFAKMTPSWAPTALTTPYGYALPIMELIFGATLAIGLFGRLSTWGVSLMMLSIVIAQFSAGMLFHNPPDVPGPYDANLILLTLALLLTATGVGDFSIDALWRKKK